MMILLMFYIINQDNVNEISFSPLLSQTRNQLEILNFQLDCADKLIGLTNNLRNKGAMYEFLYNSDQAQNCIDNFFCSLRSQHNYIEQSLQLSTLLYTIINEIVIFDDMALIDTSLCKPLFHLSFFRIVNANIRKINQQ